MLCTCAKLVHTHTPFYYAPGEMASKSSKYSILLKDKAPGFPPGRIVKLESDGRYSPQSSIWKMPYVEQPISLLSDEITPLTTEEYHILDSVPHAVDRFAVYSTPGKLAWGLGLQLGDVVLARLPELNDHLVAAIIRWCGDIKSALMFGIEIVVSGLLIIDKSMA